MTSRILRTSVVAFAFVAGGVAAMLVSPLRADDPARPGQPPAAQPPAKAQPPVAGQPTDPKALPRAWRAKEILGMKVNIAGNTAVGTVEDIVLSDGGDVEYLIVQTTDNKLFTVPWAAAVGQPDQKIITVNVTPEQFKTVQTYTVQTYPQFFTPDYRTQVYKYYGLTPRELRRIERRIDRR